MYRKLTLLLAGLIMAGGLLAADDKADNRRPNRGGERGERRERGEAPEGRERRGNPMMEQFRKFNLNEEETKAIMASHLKTRELAMAYQKDKTDANLTALKKQIESSQATVQATLKTALERKEAEIVEQKKFLETMEKEKDTQLEAQLKRMTEGPMMGEGGRRGGRGPAKSE